MKDFEGSETSGSLKAGNILSNLGITKLAPDRIFWCVEE
jgi:hypothetical protein